MLCQTLNAEFAAKGIHIIPHIVIDDAVDAPDTLRRGRIERVRRAEETRGNEHDKDSSLCPRNRGNLRPSHYQHRSAWTHEVEQRAFLRSGMVDITEASERRMERRART